MTWTTRNQAAKAKAKAKVKRTMTRVFNFSAGPAALPVEVLEEARDELLDYQGRGLSVMEMSHRSKEFVAIAEQAEADLRELLAVPEGYHVLFMPGGATLQFAAVPLNLLGEKSSADYVHTGSWASKAIAEARRYCDVHIVASSAEENFSYVPAPDSWECSADAAYLHVTGNETIGGVEYHEYPDTGAVPLVADLSSTLLSRPLDVSRFGVIYSGAQKNIGPAGITVVLVREDLAGKAAAATPSMLDYAIQAASGSMHNTPPTYSWYIAGLVFKWLKAQGGLEVMAERNSAKSGRLYSAIDTSNFYRCPVRPADRSRMNVAFTLADPELDGRFLEQAEQSDLLNLKGHRSVGGMRASLYNAVPEQAVDALIDFMQGFEADHA